MQTQSVDDSKVNDVNALRGDSGIDVSVMLSVKPRMGYLADNCEQLKQYFSLQSRSFELIVVGAFEPTPDQHNRIAAAGESFDEKKGQHFKFVRVRERLGVADHLRSLKDSFKGSKHST